MKISNVTNMYKELERKGGNTTLSCTEELKFPSSSLGRASDELYVRATMGDRKQPGGG